MLSYRAMEKKQKAVNEIVRTILTPSVIQKAWKDFFNHDTTSVNTEKASFLGKMLGELSIYLTRASSCRS